MSTRTLRYLALSGLMFAGKDHVAASVSSQVVSMSEPIALVSRHLNGTDDKSAPGIRRFMQLVGQWGWGHEAQDYPHTVERALFAQWMRGHALALDWTLPDGTEVNKSLLLRFGQEKTYWVNILTDRVTQLARMWDREMVNMPTIAVTNLRYDHELPVLQGMGFKDYVVTCTEATRWERMQKAGYTAKPSEMQDISETFAIRQLCNLPDRRIIWNDTAPMPTGKNYLSVQDFATMWSHEEPVASQVSPAS